MIENNYANALPVSVTVEELDLGTGGLMSGLLDGVEDLALADDSTAGHSSVGQTLGTGDHVRSDSKLGGTEGGSQAAKTSDDLIEDQ